MQIDLAGSDALATSGSADDAGSEERKSDFFDEDYQPDGLVYSDDKDMILVGIDQDSEDELQSFCSKDASRNKALIPGGPQPTDLSDYSKSQHAAGWKAYKRKRKAYIDKECRKCVKIAQSLGETVVKVYSGGNTNQLHSMTKVESHQFVEQQTFSLKDIVQLCIAEEANLRGIQ